MAPTMKTEVEFRLPERTARELLAPGEGEVVGGIARKLVMNADSRQFELFREMAIDRREKGDELFVSWRIHRSYSERELQNAKALRLIPETTIEPASVELGTLYDELHECPYCGTGRKQLSSLKVDSPQLPQGVQFAQTIARDEWICSPGWAGVISRMRHDGITLAPIESRSEQLRDWMQIQVDPSGYAVQILPRTVFGIDPFNRDEDGRYRCPLGHVAGLRVISEACVGVGSMEEVDFAVSDVSVGVKRGVLRPCRMIFLSVAAWNALREIGTGGYSVEIAKVDGVEEN